jgi:tetratricopeptide (TPR) repeat protein
MKILGKLIFILFFFLSSFSLSSQTKEADRLLQLARTATTIEKKVVSYANVSRALIDVDLAKSISYNNSAFNISKRHNYKQGVIDSCCKYSALDRALMDYDKALNYLNKYEEFIKDDTYKLAGAAFQKGVLNCIKGPNSKGLKNYHKALKNYELLKNERGLGITYSAIGIAYSNMKRYDEFITNYEKLCEILKSLGNIDALSSTYTT